MKTAILRRRRWAGGPTFYVDSASGSDSNDGSVSSPFLTVAKAITVLKSGSAISLARGGTWYEQADVGHIDNITIKSHGTGRYPVLNATEAFTNSAFEDSTDRSDSNTNLYSQTFTADLGTNGGTGTFAIQIFEAGEALLRVADAATAQSTAGTFYSPQHSGSQIGITSTTVEVFIHPKGSTNAKSDGKAYRYTERIFCYNVGDGCTITQVRGYGAAHNNGSFNGGVNSTFNQIVSSGSLRHQALMASGTYNGIYAQVDYYNADTGHIAVEFYTPDGSDLSCVANNVAVRNNATETGADNIILFGGHTSGDSGDEYQAWTLNDFVGDRGQVTAGDTLQWDVYRARLTTGGCRIVTDNAGPTNLYDVYATSLTNVTTNNLISNNAASNDVLIDGYRTYRTDGTAGIKFTGQGGAEAMSVTVRNSVMADAHAGSNVRRGLWDFSADVDFDLSGCIHVGYSTGSIGDELRLNVDLLDGTFAGSNNVYYPNQGNTLEVRDTGNSSNYGTMQAWLNARQPGDEVGSVIADPDLADPAAGDFTAEGVGLPTGCGLTRLNVSYLTLPADEAAAEAWLDSL